MSVKEKSTKQAKLTRTYTQQPLKSRSHNLLVKLIGSRKKGNKKNKKQKNIVKLRLILGI